MAFPILGNPSPAFFDSSGSPLADGTLAVLDPADDTNKASYPTYDDAEAATNANANPITLDARGSCNLWGLDNEDYKLVLLDSAGATVNTDDDIFLPNYGQFYATTTAETAASVTPVNFQYPEGNILRYGTNTTPGTTDMQAAFQAAVDSSDRVFIPEGDYALDSVVTLRTDSNIVGAGIGATRLIKNADTSASQGILYINSGGASTFINNIQLSDFEIDGLVTTGLFSEFQHLVSLSGVDGVIIERVKFSGAQGDGIYFGSGDVALQERHNHNMIVRNCIFDGVTSENRNAISVIDCDGIVIEGCHFYDWTKSTMPGAIDFEPDTSVYHVIKNVVVKGNTFEAIGGNLGAISVFLTANFTTQPENFTFSDNVFDTPNIDAIFFGNNQTGYARGFNISITGNSGKSARGLVIYPYTEGVSITGNAFYITASPLLGFNANDQLVSAVISGNVFQGDASATAGITIRGGNAIAITNNVFSDLVDYSILLGGFAANDTFVDGDVNTGTDRITLTGHTFTNADRVVLTTTGTLPAGLALFSVTSYYVSSIDANTIELYSDIGLSSIVDITAAAGGGTHSINDVSTLSSTLVSGNTVNNSAVGIEFVNGAVMTTTNVVISNNDLSDATTAMEGSIPADTVIRGNGGSDEIVVTTNTITAAEGGKTFYLDLVGGFTSTLPAPHRGLKYKFIVKTAPTTAYIITTNGGDNVLYGTLLDIVGEQVAITAQDTINFVASTSLIGDSLEVESDGTNWYCTAKSLANGGITVAVT